MTNPICIYHHNCADGFTAAWAVVRALGPDSVDLHPGVYGKLPPDVKGRDVIMVDFSYPADTINMMAASARSILILDHHKTAQADLAGFLRPVLTGGWHNHLSDISQPGVKSNVRALFDMDRSGAQIAWNFFHQPTSDLCRPALVNYVGDRDLWRFELEDSRAVNAFIFAHEYTMAEWDALYDLLEYDLHIAADGGKAIEKKHHKDVAELVSALRRRMVIGGQEVWAANIPYTLTSDAGNLMAQGEPFAACYWDTADSRIFSLRSTDAGMDVSAIAKSYGGGGHRNASGFRIARGAGHELLN